MPAEYGDDLTQREIEIVELVAEGLTNREIAERISLSHNTVKVHLRNIFTKSGVVSRTELTVLAMQEGWIEVPGIQPETDEADSSPADAVPTSAEAAPLPSEETAREQLDWPHHRWIALIVGLFLSLVVLVLPQNPRSEAIASNPNEVFEPGQAASGVPSPKLEDSWEEIAPLSMRRAGLGVVALSDRLYVIGGMTEDGPTDQVEIYQTATKEWNPGPPRPVALANVGAVAVGQQLLVPGGCDAQWTPQAIVHLYDVETDTWQEATSLPEPLCAYALATYKNRAFLFGGLGKNGYQAVAYVYDFTNDAWEKITAPREARGFGAAAMLSNRLFYVGGYDGKRELDTCEVYLPEEDTWESCAAMLQPRGGLGLASIGGRLQAIGGGWNTYMGFNERYDPNTDQWTVLETPIVGEWRNLGLITWEGALYAVGGWNGDYINRTYKLEILQWRIYIPTTFSNTP